MDGRNALGPTHPRPPPNAPHPVHVAVSLANHRPVVLTSRLACPRFSFKYSSVFLIGTFLTAARGMAPEDGFRVLFVGNSLTYYNGGIHQMITHMSTSPRWIAEQIVRPGAPLRTLWKDGRPQKRIESGGFHVVVIQEDLPETTDAHFEEYCAHFVRACRAAGATPLLLMTWPYERLHRTSLETIVRSHAHLANALRVAVAPAGLAFEIAARSSAELPTSLRLLQPDEEHPTVAGTYLASACVADALRAVLGRHETSQSACSYVASDAANRTPAPLEAVPPPDPGAPPWFPPTLQEDEAVWLRRMSSLARAEWDERMSAESGLSADSERLRAAAI